LRDACNANPYLSPDVSVIRKARRQCRLQTCVRTQDAHTCGRNICIFSVTTKPIDQEQEATRSAFLTPRTEQRTRTGVRDDSIAYTMSKRQKHHDLAREDRQTCAAAQPNLRVRTEPQGKEKEHVGIWLCPRCLPHGTGRNAGPPARVQARRSRSVDLNRRIIPSRFVRQGPSSPHRILICHTKRRSATRNLATDPGRYL